MSSVYSAALEGHHGLEERGVTANCRAIIDESRHVLDEHFRTALWVAPALHWSVEAGQCDDVHNGGMIREATERL